MAKEIEIGRQINQQTLTHADLVELTGYTRTADLSRYLERCGIRSFTGKAGVWTTVDAINAALGLSPANPNPKPFL